MSSLLVNNNNNNNNNYNCYHSYVILQVSFPDVMIVFSIPLISWISLWGWADRKGMEWEVGEGGGRRGQMGNQRLNKVTILTKTAVLYLCMCNKLMEYTITTVPLEVV